MGSLTLAAARPWSGRSIGAVRAGEVHLWVVPLDVPFDAGRQFLDSGERARAAGYLQPAHGARFAASRARLRRLVASYLGADPASLCFVPGPAGKPAVAVHDPAGDHAGGHRCDLVPGFEFSLTRTEDLALIGVSAGAIGVDIERIRVRPGLADLVAARYRPREADCIAAGCGLPAASAQPRQRAPRLLPALDCQGGLPEGDRLRPWRAQAPGGLVLPASGRQGRRRAGKRLAAVIPDGLNLARCRSRGPRSGHQVRVAARLNRLSRPMSRRPASRARCTPSPIRVRSERRPDPARSPPE